MLTALMRVDPQRWGHCAVSHAPLFTLFPFHDVLRIIHGPTYTSSDPSHTP